MTNNTRVIAPQKIIVLKKKAPKSPLLGVPASTLKFKKRQHQSTTLEKKQRKRVMNEALKVETKPSKQEPNISRNHNSIDNLPPSTSTVKKGEGFQWESTQYSNGLISSIEKPFVITRTLKSLHFRSPSNNSEDDEELKEYYKLLDEKW